MRRATLLWASITMILSASTALADDWTAVKLRGNVLQLIDEKWLPLERGAVVPDDRVIRTMGGARVTLVRGSETIALGGSTQIQISDQGGSRPFTTVKQHFGKVEVEAEVRAVQHFAVQTAHLAAVVKGTQFTVMSDEAESQVQVRRGAVAVSDNDDGSSALIGAGQSASVATDDVLQVAGRGKLPTVFDAKGAPVGPKEKGADKPGSASSKGKEPKGDGGADTGGKKDKGEDGRPSKKDKGDESGSPGKGGHGGSNGGDNGGGGGKKGKD